MDWEEAGTSLARLISGGEIYWDNICYSGSSDRFLSNLQEALSIVPLSKDATPLECIAYARAAPLIEIVCPRDIILPIEMLPLGLKESATPARTESEVLRAAAVVAGFSCRIRYVLYGQYPESDPRDSGILAPTRAWSSPQYIGYLRSQKAALWEEMDNFFTSGQIAAATYGPHPAPHTFTSPEALARYMLAPHLLEVTSGTPNDSPQPADTRPIIYVYADGKKGKGLKDFFFFEFQYYTGNWLNRKKRYTFVDVGDIKDAKKEILKRGGLVATSNIFLNSCLSGGGLAKEIFSCSMRLLSEGVGSVIAPRDETPAGVAKELAEAFYCFLSPVAGGDSDIRESILAARLQLLARRRNPLGLIYTHYGDPE